MGIAGLHADKLCKRDGGYGIYTHGPTQTPLKLWAVWLIANRPRKHSVIDQLTLHCFQLD